MKWKAIEGYEGVYDVSDAGQVRNVKYGHTLKHGSNKGYPSVNLSVGGKYKTKKIHRLVAIAFIDNPENLPVVNHLNGDRTDHRIENLEWCTQGHNVQHMLDEGFSRGKGNTHWSAKLTEEGVRQMRKLRDAGLSVNEIAKQFGVKHSTASLAISGTTWAHVC